MTPDQKLIIDMLNQYKVETKVTFQKCKSISRTHCMLLQSKDPSASANAGRSFEIFAFKPLLVNDKPITSKDKLVKVKNLDRIQFPCDLCPIPDVYHLIIPEGDPV